jgi:hypothetical protein
MTHPDVDTSFFAEMESGGGSLILKVISTRWFRLSDGVGYFSRTCRCARGNTGAAGRERVTGIDADLIGEANLTGAFQQRGIL